MVLTGLSTTHVSTLCEHTDPRQALTVVVVTVLRNMNLNGVATKLEESAQKRTVTENKLYVDAVMRDILSIL